VGGADGVRLSCFRFTSTNSYKIRQLRLNNEKLRMKQEEIEVETMLLVLSDSDDDDPSDSDELECVPDSEGYLLLAPDSDGA